MVRLNISAIKDATSERNRSSYVEESEHTGFSFKNEDNDHNNEDEKNPEWPDD